MSLGITGGVLAGVGAIGGSALSGFFGNKAAKSEEDAAAKANAQQRQDQMPWTQAGGAAVTQLGSDLGVGGKFNQTFTMADAQNSDAEKYAQSQALDASQNSAAARGGLIGTNEQKDIETNAAGIASQYQGQAFNQWLQTNQQQIGALESTAGLGQASATNVADTGANLTVGAGNAAAAGDVAVGNAIGGGVSALGSQLTTLSKLFGTTGSPSTNPTGTAVLNSAGGGDIGAAGGTYDYSDRRLKTDVKRVGYTDDNVPIYSYRMKGSDGPHRLGVMADELEKSNPRAVTQDSQGLRMVDYRRVVH